LNVELFSVLCENALFSLVAWTGTLGYVYICSCKYISRDQLINKLSCLQTIALVFYGLPRSINCAARYCGINFSVFVLFLFCFFVVGEEGGGGGHSSSHSCFISIDFYIMHTYLVCLYRLFAPNGKKVWSSTIYFVIDYWSK
jgi:hypothetical protein